MTREPDRPAGSPATLDDDQLAALVRAGVEEWRLPPQRLDQPTWRDRVGARGTGRRRRWFARLAGPLAAAVLATVLVALAAVWLTSPRSNAPIGAASPTTAGGSPTSGATSPRGSAASPSAPPSPPASSGLPVLQVNGALPDPYRVMVRSDATYRLVDLSTGTLGPASVGSHLGPQTMLARPSGGWACICTDWTGSGGATPTTLVVTFETVAADGTRGTAATLRTVRGEPDPSLSAGNQPELVDAAVSASTDGRYAFLGWSARHGANGWTAGVDVVDLDSGAVVDSIPLDVVPPGGAANRTAIRVAPKVTLSPSGAEAFVSSFWYVDSPSSTPPSGTDHWITSFSAGALGALSAAGSTAGETCAEADSGPIDATTWWALCLTPAGPLSVERHRTDGSRIDTTAVPGTRSGLEQSSLVLRQGDRLFIWDPVTVRLARFDLRSATMDSAAGTALAPARSGSPLDAIAGLGRQVGRWLAPSVAAKIFLEPALVASPDGSRIYALGVEPPVGESGGASRGVYAFDAGSVEPVGRWAPTADLVSLAISPDGQFVYAAGQAGVDAAGASAPYQASITVYATSDGSVRLIAGTLGDGLVFPSGTTR